MLDFDVVLTKRLGPALRLSRAERIAFLKIELAKAALAAVDGASASLVTFFQRAILGEENDARYAEAERIKRVNYRAHLASRYWLRLRARKAIAVAWRCEECGEQHGLNLQLHHPRYDKLGFEEISDVQALCDTCHKSAHGLEVA
jgi:hypothetical protein